MDFLLNPLSDMRISSLHTFIDDWGFLIAIGVLLVEILVLTLRKKVSRNLVGDSIANFVTLSLFLAITYLVIGTGYVIVLYLAYTLTPLGQLPVNGISIAAVILLADLAYYWEHRFLHRVNFAWGTHAVHHSSPYFNISVAYRFGPLDGLMPLPFHLPLALLGFNPLLILFAEMIVQLYQTLLHTEMVGKFPLAVEAIMNTPSHHRVHHGSNPQYLDKNYAGIFIIWDRLFGTFEEETQPVIYGLTEPVNSINPLKIFFQGYYTLLSRAVKSASFTELVGVLFKGPEWHPGALHEEN